MTPELVYDQTVGWYDPMETYCHHCHQPAMHDDWQGMVGEAAYVELVCGEFSG